MSQRIKGVGAHPFFLITDMHLNHTTAKKFVGRPENYQQRIISGLSKLSADSTLIDLGDVIMSDYQDLAPILKNCRATKILVRGNHDLRSYSWYIEQGYSFVCESFTWPGILFSHRPVPKKHWGQGVQYNIYGHLHGNTQHHGIYGNCEAEPGHLHYSLEDFGFGPRHLNEVLHKFGVGNIAGPEREQYDRKTEGLFFRLKPEYLELLIKSINCQMPSNFEELKTIYFAFRDNAPLVLQQKIDSFPPEAFVERFEHMEHND